MLVLVLVLVWAAQQSEATLYFKIKLGQASNKLEVI